MKYLLLALAIIFEVTGSGFMKAADGFTRPWPTLFTFLAYIVSLYCFSMALRYIPLGVAYAIWGGIGIVLTAIISIVIFNQRLDAPAIIGIVLIVSGVVIMNLFSKTASH